MAYFIIWTEYVDYQNNTSIKECETKEECLEFLNDPKFKREDPKDMVQYSIDTVIEGERKNLKTEEVVIDRRFVFQ